MSKRLSSALFLVVFTLLLAGCDSQEKSTAPDADKTKASDKTWRDSFNVDLKNLSSAGRNKYWILEPGYQLVLEGKDKKTQLTVTVLDETKIIEGIETRVVEEKETSDGKVKEASKNYFAMDKTTNDLYYFGEDVGGAWLHGKDGARFGLMMPGNPKVGDKFYQEIAPKVAMDRARIASLTETITTPAGKFEGCMKSEEGSALESGKAYKYYAPGVGLVQEGDLKLVKFGKK